MIIGNREFKDKNKTYIMGILNVTPDSFSDGGRYYTTDKALYHAEEMIRDGADIIDVGGESTRPGYVKIGTDEELKRVLPVVEALVREFDIPVSVDTYRSITAEEVLATGAALINDIWGLRYADNETPMAEVVAKYDSSVCIMHNNVKGYVSGIDEIVTELEESVDIAIKAGIKRDRIMIDPGVGFAKDYDMNMSVIANLSEFGKLGFPVLLGTSNKSVIGKTLDLPADDRLEGTLATTAMAIISNCSFVRVHDVKSNKRYIDMLEGILKYKM